jgi:hypothetical protein
MAALGLIFLAIILIFLSPLIGIIVGAFAGWVVGLFFPDTLGLISQMLHIEAAPWQLGAIFGFIGGFFRGTVNTSKS